MGLLLSCKAPARQSSEVSKLSSVPSSIQLGAIPAYYEAFRLDLNLHQPWVLAFDYRSWLQIQAEVCVH